ERIEVLERRVVRDEESLQSGFQKPAADFDLAGSDVAKIGSKRWSEALTGDFGGDDVEVNEVPFFGINDLGLGCSDRQICGGAVAGIFDHHREGEWNTRFDFVREGIIAQHIALMEVGQMKLSDGLNRDRRGRKRDSDLRAILNVAEAATDEIVLRSARG